MDLCEYTKKLWRLYSLGDTQEIEESLFERMSDDIVVIGTGRYEQYDNLAQFMQSVDNEREERSQIRFHIESLSCQEKRLNPLSSLVYGKLHLTGLSAAQDTIVNMDTRFTLVYSRDTEDTDHWKLVHIHQSLPYAEQMEGEYYPKTLMEPVGELKILADSDLLTGLLNHQAFYNRVAQLPIETDQGYFMLLDLDSFKQVNDTYGHIYGDQVLKEVGAVLQSEIRREDWAGRIGGDEFALYCRNISDDQSAVSMAKRIINSLEKHSENSNVVLPGVSIGIARKTSGISSREVLHQADRKMYQAKQQGKNQYCI